jgi:DNA-binding NarL/FixJ family response regulator
MYETFPLPGTRNPTKRVSSSNLLPPKEAMIVHTLDPKESTNVMRVLVVDDHPAFRKALTSALSLVQDIEVAGEAGGGLDACTQAENLQPDAIIMDLSMPDLDGIGAMKRIHESQPHLPVVILTAHADEGVEREAREAGASGFLAKGTGLSDLVVVLHEAAEPVV